MQYEIICISDIHLGSDICQAVLLEKFLSTIQCKELILNGDVFDNFDFRRLKKHHWHVLSKLRKLSDKIKITWIEGNHDGPAELISHLLGIEVLENYKINSGEATIYFEHGHQYDDFLVKHPILTNIADFFYLQLQKIDPTFKLCIAAKKSSKTFLRNVLRVKTKAIQTASRFGYDIVCCGHTHFPEEEKKNPKDFSFPIYYNSGSWTELPCTYLTIDNGIVTLKEYS